MHRESQPALDLVILSPTPTPYFEHYFNGLSDAAWPGDVRVIFTHALTNRPVSSHERYHVISARFVRMDWDPGMRARWQEWRLGQQIIRRLMARRPGCVLLIGYRDPCRLRVMRWCRRSGVPVFAWSDINSRGSTETGWRARTKRQYVQWIDRQLNAWLVCGSVGQDYLGRFGIACERVFLSPCEPDYAQIDAIGDGQIQSARSRFTLSSSRRRLVCSGRFVPTKRFDLVIRAFCKIADALPEWDLVVAGDGAEGATLRAMVPDRLANRLIFTGFIADPDDVWAVYKACDVLVHLADHEPWGLIVNEAAACGLAIVCTDVVGAAVELVRDGFNGRIVKRDDVPQAVSALMDVTDPAKLDAFKVNSKTMLDAWRAKADPIEGFKQALTFAGVLKP